MRAVLELTNRLFDERRERYPDKDEHKTVLDGHTRLLAHLVDTAELPNSIAGAAPTQAALRVRGSRTRPSLAEAGAAGSAARVRQEAQAWRCRPHRRCDGRLAGRRSHGAAVHAQAVPRARRRRRAMGIASYHLYYVEDKLMPVVPHTKRQMATYYGEEVWPEALEAIAVEVRNERRLEAHGQRVFRWKFRARISRSSA